ncbi:MULTISPECIES: hypothetical protein [unclassified Microcoleus]|uniref:hypothetical protein n=1 Tax=unclassified Microcoleus TaxID=2642155 RepID=UPI002FCE8875
MATIQELAVWLAQFLKNLRLIIFGLLIVWGPIFFSQKLVMPELFKRWKNGDCHSV